MPLARPLSVLALTLSTVGHCIDSHAQEIKSTPGRFDYYVLNMSWAPAFCDAMKTLTPAERASNSSEDLACETPRDFVLHGLWTQNNDGTYPGYCSQRPGPAHPERSLDMTPNLALLRHEWAKHGTCTTLSPEGFFATARQAYKSITIPPMFTSLGKDATMRPSEILTLFHRANPAFPQGSFVLSCSQNQLSAVEACFNKDMQPIACVNLKGCAADAIKVVSERSGTIVQ
ncbi:ribonuclease I [Terriglobus roseus DSM 18391]|uniref:Ribonuclease I n=1 Tax=Terriglobus roseus (strain DSM 18391 / NRRL B-41598 / KBS 63) TaxID=926566 RepID=I3ZD51_TERRK|nr:ribonuclease I [Terriglobus roseus]AFL87169.1 ribonuclease I [Terriglobus roseus DSM 18391]